jgi:hypothetical protein
MAAFRPAAEAAIDLRRRQRAARAGIEASPDVAVRQHVARADDHGSPSLEFFKSLFVTRYLAGSHGAEKPISSCAGAVGCHRGHGTSGTAPPAPTVPFPTPIVKRRLSDFVVGLVRGLCVSHPSLPIPRIVRSSTQKPQRRPAKIQSESRQRIQVPGILIRRSQFQLAWFPLYFIAIHKSCVGKITCYYLHFLQ